MAGTTTNLSLRYPSATDPDNVPGDMQNLATDVDTVLSKQGLAANRPAPGHKGALYYATDTDRLSRDDGTAWHDFQSKAVADAAYPLKANLPILEASVATTETTIATVYSNLTTNGPDVVFTAPASGRVLVVFSANAQNNGSNLTYVCPALFLTAGLVLVQAAGDGSAALGSLTSLQTLGRAFMYTGLTPGTSYTARLQYRVAAGTGTFQSRFMQIIPSV